MQPEAEQPTGLSKSTGAPEEEPPRSDTPTAGTEGGLPPAAPMHRHRLLSWLWPLLVLLALLAAGAWLLANRDFAIDWAVTKGYRPPADIQALATDDTMTAYGRRLFYVNRPKIQNRDEFNRNCTNVQDEVTVLGCYVGNRHGIFVYNVTDARLAGIQQVTAAHEMLHQAYDRLSKKERTHIDQLLTAYAKTVTDSDLLAKFDTYKQTEPTELANEYHSIFGTEVATLPKELEQYYARYFTSRAKVVGYHNQYQAEFTSRINQVKAYDLQLDSLKQRIDAAKNEINNQETALKARRNQLDAYLASDRIAAYNAAVPGFNEQVQAYKTLITQTNQLIDQYNRLIAARNAIAVEEQQLQQAIDSHAGPASAQ